MPVSLQNMKTHVPRFFSTKWETCKINIYIYIIYIMCILECWQTPKPLQNQEPEVSANYKMFPLQNQEPAFAYPCRHLGCPKKWFWRTPAGPDNGVDFFGVLKIHKTPQPHSTPHAFHHSTTMGVTTDGRFHVTHFASFRPSAWPWCVRSARSPRGRHWGWTSGSWFTGKPHI